MRPWLEGWQGGPRVLARDEMFLLATERSESFDSRYFGPVSVRDIRAVVERVLIKTRTDD